MSSMFYIGLGFSSCAGVQFLSFISHAFPSATVGSELIQSAIVLGILTLGFTHWVTLRLQGYRHQDHWQIGFMPTIVLGSMFLLCKLAGFVLAA